MGRLFAMAVTPILIFQGKFGGIFKQLSKKIVYPCGFLPIVKVNLSHQYHVSGNPGTSKNPLLAQC